MLENISSTAIFTRATAFIGTSAAERMSSKKAVASGSLSSVGVSWIFFMAEDAFFISIQSMVMSSN